MGSLEVGAEQQREAHSDAVPQLQSAHSERANVELRPLSAKETKLRCGYLRQLKRDLTEKLDASIHRARHIDLGIENLADATLPWGYRNPFAENAQYTTLDEALDDSRHRLLILGHPGSGKTTTQLHVALQLVEVAEEDPHAPIPVMVNLSGFPIDQYLKEEQREWTGRQDSSEELLSAFELWLASESHAFWRKLPASVVQQWIREGRIAAFLDGLDEVMDTRRSQLARMLNQTFITKHTDVPIVVCSRVYEYEALKHDPDAVLQLDGGISLQSLTPEKIEAYLDAARATELKQALNEDPALAEMAETPLMLSMMTLAYVGLPDIAVPDDTSPVERRYHMMETYVDRMLQRVERRRKGKVCDNHPANDISKRKYKYSPKRINRSLGWLARRLSTRMRTSVRENAIYSLLVDEGDPADDAFATSIALFTTVSTVVAIVLALLTPWLQVSPTNVISSVIGVGAVCTLIRTVLNHNVDNDDGSELSIGIVFFKAALLICMAIHALRHVFEWEISEYALLSIVITSQVLVVFVIAWVMDLSEEKLYRMVIAGGVGFGCAWLAWWFGVPAQWSFAIVPVCSFMIAMEIVHSAGWRSILLGSVAIGAISSGLLLFSSIVWQVAMPATFTAAVLAPFLIHRRAYIVSGLMLAAGSCGTIIQGQAGCILGLFLAVLNLLYAAFIMVDDLDRWVAFPKSWQAALDRVFYTPLTRFGLGIFGRFPIRSSSQLSHCQDALLLKQSRSEVEFVHRSLRDYFALREIRPKLTSPDQGIQIQALKDLGYQGISAVDTLAEWAVNPKVELRRTAVRSLCRIAHPEIVPALSRAAKDVDPRVRRAVAYANKFDFLNKLLRHLRDDPDPIVVAATYSDDFLFDHDIYIYYTDYGKFLRDANIVRANIEHILFSIKYDELAGIRRLSAFGLGLTEDPAYIPALNDALADADREVVIEAAFAITAIDLGSGLRHLVKLLQERRLSDNQAHRICRHLTELYRGCRNPQIPESLNTVLQTTRSPDLRRRIARSLDKLNELRTID